MHAPRRRLSRTPVIVTDPLTNSSAELRAIQPYQATKSYRCPGCTNEIFPGTGHVVIVPLTSPEERRHWHRSCWEQRHRRGPRR